MIEYTPLNKNGTPGSPVQISPGRFARKYFDPLKPAINDKEYEIFHNEILEMFKPPEFEVTSAENIYKIYTDTNNIVMTSNIAKSCLRSSEKAVFQLFVDHKEKVSLLVARNSEKKVVGRALLWMCSIGKFMDRVYSSDPVVESHFFKWAAENGFIRKTYQAHDKKIFFTKPDGSKFEGEATLEINPIYYDKVPYLDTFTFYNLKERTPVLSNLKKTGTMFSLDTTDGNIRRL